MKTILRHSFGWSIAHRRSLALLFAFTLVLLLLAYPGALAADVFNNINPAPQLPPGGWVGRYPIGDYALDEYFPAISVGFTSGVDASGLGPMIAYFGAETLWEITVFLANGVILLFALAFNLDLVNGNGSPGSGGLAPISQAIHNLYTTTFGAPWLIAVVSLVGCWAMWKALIQRRYTETAGALAVSLLYFVLAIGIVTQPERTIGPASKLSNQLSTALLSLTSEGSVGNESQAKTETSNQLFELLVLNPWTVLEFGGVEHCATVNHGKPRSIAVRPLSPDPKADTKLATQLEYATEITADGKTCINNRNKYATHFLSYAPSSKERGEEHEALEHGDSEDLPDSDAGKSDGTFPLGPADEPAAEAMGKGGQTQRLLLALVILIGEAGAYLLLGALAVGVILAQILLLTLLAFAPVALLIGIFPGRGHDFFRAWISKLAAYLARKVIYSLILAVILAVCRALDDATSNLGWLLAFALQAAFLWSVFLQRNRLTTDLLGGTVGSRAARESTNSRLANLFYATGLTRMMSIPQLPWRSNTPPSPNPQRKKPDAPTSGGKDDGGDTPSGGSPSGEGSPPPNGGSPPWPDLPEPGPHDTPTHGPGAPPPNTSTEEQTTTTEQPHAVSVKAPQATGETPAIHAGNPPAEDELPSVEQASTGSTRRPNSTPDPAHTDSLEAPPPTPTPTETTTTKMAARTESASPSTSQVAASTQRPVVVWRVPPPVPNTPAPAPARSTHGRSDYLGDLSSSQAQAQGAEAKPATQAPVIGGDQASVAVDPAIPVEDAVAVSLRAQQSKPATGQTVKEDDLT